MERSCEKQPKSRKFDLSVTMQLQEESEFIFLARQDTPAINNITLPGKTFWMNCTSFSILFTVFFLCIERSLTPYYTVKVYIRLCKHGNHFTFLQLQTRWCVTRTKLELCNVCFNISSPIDRDQFWKWYSFLASPVKIDRFEPFQCYSSTFLGYDPLQWSPA